MDAADFVTGFSRAIERKVIDVAIAATSADTSRGSMPIDPIVVHDSVHATLRMFLAPAAPTGWTATRQQQIDGRVVVNERLDRFQIGNGWLKLPVAGFFELDDAGLIPQWPSYCDTGSCARQLAAFA